MYFHFSGHGEGLAIKTKTRGNFVKQMEQTLVLNKAFLDTIKTQNKKFQNILVTVLQFARYFREICFGHRMINEIKEVGGITFIYEPIKCLNTNSEKNATTMVYGQIPPSGI